MDTLALRPAVPSRPLAWEKIRLPQWTLPLFMAATAVLVRLRPALDPDLGWHLRVGEGILASHSTPKVDTFSYTMTGTPWADFEWLTEAGLAALHGWLGILGPILASSLIMAASVTLVYAYLRLRSAPTLLAALGAAVALVNLVPYADVRPGMVGPLFVGLFLCVAELARSRGNPRWLLLLLLPAQLLWAKMHGSYIQALILCGTYGAAALWERRSLRAAIPWAGLGAGLLTVSLANPLGLGLLRFTLGASHMTWNHDHNGEWQAPNFHDPTSWPVMVTILLALAVLAIWRPKSVGKPEMLLLLGGSLAVLQSNQFIPFFAVAAAPVLAQLVYGALTRPVHIQLKLTHACAFALVLTVLGAAGVRGLQPAAYDKALASAYPEKAVAYIQSEHLDGPLFNDFDWGCYLISAMPRLPVFVDGRTEMYGDNFLQQYWQVATGRQPFDPLFQQYGVRLALIKPDSPLANELRQDGGWREAYHDKLASVFVAGSQGEAGPSPS